MFPIEQSAFLQALGQAIGHSLWQVAALWLAYATISNIGKLSSGAKYLLAAGASLAGLVWFAATLVHCFINMPHQQLQTGTYAEAGVEAGSSLAGYLVYIYNCVAVSLTSLAPYISCAYLLLFAVLCIRLGNGFRQVHFFATQGLQKPPVAFRLFVEQYAAAIGISQKVKLFTSTQVQSPLTLGFWKPVILLPVASLTHLTVVQIESILLHELAHIRRHDYVVNIFLQIAEAGLFFNPFMRLLLKQAKLEREISCDEYVLQFEYSPKEYAKALLAIEHNSHTALLALAAKGTQSFQLLNRIKRMVAPQPKAFNYRQQLGMLLLLTVLTLGFTIIIPHPQKKVVNQPTAAAKNENIASQVSSSASEALPVLAENTPLPPPPPPVLDVIKALTQSNTNEVSIDEKELEAYTRQVELKAAEAEKMGNEVQKQMEPFVAQMQAWTDSIAATANHSPFDYMSVVNQVSQLKNFPSRQIAAISATYQKKLSQKLAELDKAVSFVNQLVPGTKKMAALRKQFQQNAGNQPLDQDAINALKEAYQDSIEAVNDRQQERQSSFGRHSSRERCTNGNEKDNEQSVTGSPYRQKQNIKKTKPAVNQIKLNLGLFTDDRDSTNAGLLAKFQRYFPRHFVFTNTPVVPPGQQINSKYTIRISDKKVTVSNEPDTEPLPASQPPHGQTIDVHHEKQLTNGQEEKVVVISISTTK